MKELRQAAQVIWSVQLSAGQKSGCHTRVPATQVFNCFHSHRLAGAALLGVPLGSGRQPRRAHVCTRALPSTKLPPARSILNHCRAAASGRSEGSAHDLLLCRCMPLTLGLDRKLGYTPLATCLLESRLESFACTSEHLKRTVWLSAASATPAVYLQQTTTVTDVLSWSETAAAPSVKMHAQS